MGLQGGVGGNGGAGGPGLAGKDGAARGYLSNKFPVRDVDGQVVGIGGISTDITDRMAVEERLRRSEAQQRALFMRSLIATALISDPGPGRPAVVTAVNPAMEALIGTAACDLVGVDPLTLVA